MLDPQNFSVYANSPIEVEIDINPDGSLTLVGATIVWKAYEQTFGMPNLDQAVITKDNGVDGTITVTDPDTQTLEIPIEPGDTTSLLGNYYHELTVDGLPVAIGIMTVLVNK